jgi:tetratricopeptide (TPR) repeat protein
MAWQEGMEAITCLIPDVKAAIASPSEWAGMVVRHSSLPALPFAVANYPQRVRELSVLVQAKDWSKLRPNGEQTQKHTASGSIRSWAAKQMQKGDIQSGLAAVGILRAVQDFDLASEYLQTLAKVAKPEWKAALANEEAAILWQRGKAEEALAIWNGLPESTVVVFNRGMAALFLGQLEVAQESLTKAVKGLAESSAWHHLASVYLALAEMRR